MSYRPIRRRRNQPKTNQSNYLRFLSAIRRSDRSAQLGSLFVCEGELPNREGNLLASSAVRIFAERRIRKAAPERSPISGFVGLADATAEDEAATGTAFALMQSVD
jgi:hypothetical protein